MDKRLFLFKNLTLTNSLKFFVVRAVVVGQAGCVGDSMADGEDVNLFPVWILVKSTFKNNLKTQTCNTGTTF